MPQPKYIWVFPTLLHRWIWKDLARELARRTNLRPLFIIASEEDRVFWNAQFGEPLDAEIAVHFDYLSYALDGGDRSEPLDSILERAAEYERRHGITVMRDMVLGCRHIGRGFILGGKGHATSPVPAMIDHRLAVQTCLGVADYFEALAEQYPPGLMLIGGGGGGLYMKPACVIARRLGIPFRSLVHGRFDEFYFWADSEFEESGAFRHHMLNRPLPSKEEAAQVIGTLRPTGLSVFGFAGFRRDLAWSSIMRRIVMTYARYAYGRLRGYKLARVGYRPGSVARMIVRQRRDLKKLRRLAKTRLCDLQPGQKVVYFAFQTEPEQALNVLSPDHTNQMATAVEIALSLPANVVLAVKEHPGQIGRRTPGIYEALTEIPNIAFIHPDEPGLEVVARADMVAVITSSAGYEAAVMGKQVLHFGRHGHALDLPHVHPMSGFSDMRRIPELLADDSPEALERRKRDGARYMLALKEFGLDMSTFAAHGRQARPSDQELGSIIDNLSKTLPPEELKLSA
jgi:hypothetical protein